MRKPMVLVLLAIALALSGACAHGVLNPDSHVRTSDILADPGQWMDKQVDVLGNVGYIGDRAFTIGKGDAKMLVVTAPNTGYNVSVWNGKNVEVVGSVKMASQVNLKNDPVFQGLDEMIFHDWVDKPVIVAGNIQAAR